MAKFQHGDIIVSPANETYLISNIKNNQYIMQKPNLLTEMDIQSVDKHFKLEENPVGFMVYLQRYIRKQYNIQK